MRFKPILVSVVLLTLISLPVHSDVELSQRPEVADALRVLDTWIEQQVDYLGVPGLSIAIVYDQDVVWAKGYGFADLERKTRATPSTVYRIGSITKLFTATAILQLRDQGKLRLDDPVSRYLPWFHLHDSVPDAPEITIHQLLTHTSGLPREADFPYWTDHIFPTRAQLAAVVPTQDAVYPPDTAYHYSNLGVSLLGEIVTEVSGKPWAEYVQEMILDPLGMRNSSGSPGEELLQRRATPYMMRAADGSRRVFAYYDAGAIAPAANMVSTVEDLALFASLQFDDGPAGGDHILRGSTLREMQRVHWVYPSFSGGRGLGFAVSHRDGKNFVGHGGWIGGNRTNLMLVPSEKIAVVVALNADDGSPYTIAKQAYAVVAPVLLKATRKPEAAKPTPDPAWRKYLGRYTDPWGWEYKVMILDGDLVMYSYDRPPGDNASSGYTRLMPVGGATFRMPDNELVTFEVDADGSVVRIKRRNDYIFPKEK